MTRASLRTTCLPSLGLLCFLYLALLGGACSNDSSQDSRFVLQGEIVSLQVGQPGWVLTTAHLYDQNHRPISLPEKERGHRLSAAWVDEDQTIWLGYDRGLVYRSTDGGDSWQAELEGYVTPDMVLIELSLLRPIPRRFLRLEDGQLYLATVGRGVMRFDEDQGAWVDQSFRFDLDGNANPLAWTITPMGRGLVAGFINPRGIIPPEYVEMFGQAIRTMSRSGQDMEQLEIPEEIRLVTAVAQSEGQVVLASLGHGIWRQGDSGWSQLWPDEPPADLWQMALGKAGQIAAITLSGDVWLNKDGAWNRVRCGGDGSPGADIIWAGGQLVVGVGDELLQFSPKQVSCPERGGARVLLGFSQHTNLYHSYRGDTNDEDGFGKDIRIIRETLDMFDAQPALKNDWDIENLFSLDDWLPQFAPDILDNIVRRVEAGQDGIRLMSWNNGLMASETEEEFALSISRAKDSLEAFVPGLWTKGVQPQENTYTPAHVDYYKAQGIDWITLFYSANSFTGFRHELKLDLTQAHSLLHLQSELGSQSMTLVPVYHHADVIEHGGLANPSLHPGREAVGDAVSSEAQQRAADGLALAAADQLPAGQWAIYNPGDTAQKFLQPIEQALLGPTAVRSLSSPDGLRHWLVGSLEPEELLPLSPGQAQMAPAQDQGSGWAPELDGLEFSAARMRIGGLDHLAQLEQRQLVQGEGARVWTMTGSWDVGQGGQVRYDWISLDEEPEVLWLSVEVTFPVVEDHQLPWWEDAVPLELILPAAQSWNIHRLLTTGQLASYQVNKAADALNNHAAADWVSFQPQGAQQGLIMENHAPLRAAPAFAPLRLVQSESGELQARVAPFGVLWGELPDHWARSLLGTGLAEYTTRLVSPQIKSTAPAWSGQTACFLLKLKTGPVPDDPQTSSGFRQGMMVFAPDGQATMPPNCL